jgi:hypothetical protein
MKLELMEPVRAWNWMLVASELQDPANWSVFLLNHGPDTQRYHFEAAVQQASSEKNVSLTPFRLKCQKGLCTLEYPWGANSQAVKAHAQRVAEILAMDIELPRNLISQIS